MPSPPKSETPPAAEWWILGLGNPGTRYAPTRHNLGFRVVDALAQNAGVSLAERSSDSSRIRWRSARDAGGATVVQPMTYMNRSGSVAEELVQHHAAVAERMLIVYDDIDLDLGTIRLRPRGGSGGHNGIRSLIDHLETDRFPRLRLGIRGAGLRQRAEEASGASAAPNLADYVLEPFESDELEVVDRLIQMAASAAEAVVCDGLPIAMNRWNGRSATEETEPKQTELERSKEPKSQGTATNIRSNGNDGISG